MEATGIASLQDQPFVSKRAVHDLAKQSKAHFVLILIHFFCDLLYVLVLTPFDSLSMPLLQDKNSTPEQTQTAFSFPGLDPM